MRKILMKIKNTEFPKLIKIISKVVRSFGILFSHMPDLSEASRVRMEFGRGR
jgi:hypothetical protein